MGYTDQLIMKIIDNIQLTIKNIHLRYEDEIKSNSYSLGVTIDEIKGYLQ